MKIEICDNTKIAVIVVAVAIAVTCACLFVTRSYNERVLAAFAAGYEEATLPGTNSIAWVKTKR